MAMPMIRIILLMLLLICCQANAQAAPGTVVVAPGSAADFTLAAPLPDPAAKRMIFSTAYIAYLADAATGPGSVPLTDTSGSPLGPRLSHGDWCHAAMEGTVSVREAGGGFRTFNFAKTGQNEITYCKDVFTKVSASVLAGTNRVTWAAVPPDAPYGLGVASFRLVPFRSLAVDASVFHVGTVLFIPSLRGTPITLPDGRQAMHDGFVMAADRGGAIKGAHIDFFKGPNRSDAVPAGLASDAQHTIPAFIVSDPTITAALRALHQRGG